jgi:hypothetical protein
MMKKITVFLTLLLLLLAAGRSRAWVHVGFHGHWHGPRVGVYVGPGWWDDPYYSDYYPAYPYSYPYYSYYPYAPYYPPPAYGQAPMPAPGNPPAEAASSSTPSTSETSRRDLNYINSLITHARDAVKFQYDDGDISADERDRELQHINEVQQEAYAQANAGGGTISVQQERALWDALRTGQPLAASSAVSAAPSTPSSYPPKTAESLKDIRGVTDQLARLRSLLDKKLAAGSITKAQRDGEAGYITQLEKVARAQAQANGGQLTADQETALREELSHIESVIQHDLVVR